MDIEPLLNTSDSEHHTCHNSTFPTSSTQPRAVFPASSQGIPYRELPAHSVAVSEGRGTVGIVNYPPHEAGDNQALLAQHRVFQIHPSGEISKNGVARIARQEKSKENSGRHLGTTLQVFYYTYKLPNEKNPHLVVWDYNTGLVRMKPFFCSQKHPLTALKNALQANRKLHAVSYRSNFGGGRCDEFWVPYEAAKAIAETFCYDIRWALTPIFGEAFLSTCLKPKDPRFANYAIDPAVVAYCIREKERAEQLESIYKAHKLSAQATADAPMSRRRQLSSNISTRCRRHARLGNTGSGYTSSRPSRLTMPAERLDREPRRKWPRRDTTSDAVATKQAINSILKAADFLGASALDMPSLANSPTPYDIAVAQVLILIKEKPRNFGCLPTHPVYPLLH